MGYCRPRQKEKTEPEPTTSRYMYAKGIAKLQLERPPIINQVWYTYLTEDLQPATDLMGLEDNIPEARQIYLH